MSSLVIIFLDIRLQILVFFTQLFFAIFFKARIREMFFKLRKFMIIFLFLIIVQSVFDRQGNAIISIFNFTLITDQGIIRGVSYLIRLFVVLVSGAIIVTSSQKETIQGLVKLKVPYDLALMSSVGIRFLPLLIEQMQDTLIAIQLRGIEINSLRLADKVKVYSYIFAPVIISTLEKAKSLSLSIEMRAFRIYKDRTSLIELSFSREDYVLLFVNIALLVIFIYFGNII